MTTVLSRRTTLRMAASAALAATLSSWTRPAWAAAPATLDGMLTQGGLIFGRTDPGSAVWLDGAPVMVAPDGHFVFGFGRDAAPAAKLKVRHADGVVEERQLAIVKRTYLEQRINNLAQNMVTPDEAELKQIADDNARLQAARRAQAIVPWYEHGIDWPVHGPISGVYGSVRILNGQPRAPHTGVDIAAPEGTPIRSPADGIVRLAATGMVLTGGTTVIDHGQGLSSTLMHQSALLVHPGLFVSRGQVVGKVGHTGRATGPHCHWGMNWRNAWLDPALLVPPMPAPAPAPAPSGG